MDPDPHTAAVILARGGSKGIPQKNMVNFLGQPLVCHCIEIAKKVKGVNSVWVSTDDNAICAAAAASGARVHRRSAATCTDTASSTAALLEFLRDTPAVSVLCLLQCTSPLTRPGDVSHALQLLRDGYDSVFALVRRTPGLQWRPTDSGELEPVNFDPLRRPRRQDLPGQLVESGNFYITHAALLRQTGKLQSGRRWYVEVPELCAVDIDTAADLQVARALAACQPRTAPGPAAAGGGAAEPARATEASGQGDGERDTLPPAEEGCGEPPNPSVPSHQRSVRPLDAEYGGSDWLRPAGSASPPPLPYRLSRRQSCLSKAGHRL